MSYLLIGCDPELPIRDKITGDFMSAHDIFPGTKKSPFAVDKGAIQVDGLAFEFNINPAETAEEFDKNIETVLIQAQEILDDKTAGDFEFVFEPVADYDRNYFSVLPFESKILGCDPDFDENGVEKIPPDGMQELPFRTMAGHIHIGMTEGADPRSESHMESCKRIARAFKTAPGFFPVTPNEFRRVKYYGAPPSFRPKHYGIELRSPSNLWVKSRAARRSMFERTVARFRDIAQ